MDTRELRGAISMFTILTIVTFSRVSNLHWNLPNSTFQVQADVILLCFTTRCSTDVAFCTIWRQNLHQQKDCDIFFYDSCFFYNTCVIEVGLGPSPQYLWGMPTCEVCQLHSNFKKELQGWLWSIVCIRDTALVLHLGYQSLHQGGPSAQNVLCSTMALQRPG